VFTAAISRICTVIIAHSPHAKSQVAKEFLACDSRRILVVPHGNYVGVYPNTISQAEARRQLSIPKDRLVIGFVGNLRRYKGVDRLMRILRSIPDPEVVLLIAGSSFDNGYSERLSSLAEQDGRIVFHARFLPDDDMQVYFNAADVMAFPYHTVLTSGAVLLAMSFGRACLAPKLGSIPDYVDESCGVLFDGESEEALRLGIEQIITRRCQLANMGASALRKCLNWRWSDIAATTLLAYGIPLDANEARIIEAARARWWHDGGTATER